MCLIENKDVQQIDHEVMFVLQSPVISNCSVLENQSIKTCSRNVSKRVFIWGVTFEFQPVFRRGKNLVSAVKSGRER